MNKFLFALFLTVTVFVHRVEADSPLSGLPTTNSAAEADKIYIAAGPGPTSMAISPHYLLESMKGFANWPTYTLPAELVSATNLIYQAETNALASATNLIYQAGTNAAYQAATGLVNTVKFRLTNSWANGPTGAVDLFYPRQRFRASTPCYISGFLSRSNSATGEVLLSVDNIASTNIWVTLTNGFKFSSTITNTAVVTNGTTLKLWLEYDPSGANSVGESNAVARQFNLP